MEDIIRFIIEVDQLKGVERKVRPVGLTRYENPAEHSWQLGVLALCLADYAETGTNINRAIRMLLVHDIGEIDAGDAFVFKQGGWEEQKAAELAAVQRIFEARFANAVDRAMPVLLNLANNGGSWRENNVSYDRVVGRVECQIREGCPALWEYIASRLKEAHRGGWFGISNPD